MKSVTAASLIAASLFVLGCEDANNTGANGTDNTSNNATTNNTTGNAAGTDTARGNQIEPGSSGLQPNASPNTDSPALATPGTTPPGTDADVAMVPPDLRVLSILHVKNEQEIQAGQLALERGTSDAVKQYGQMLVDDHTANDTKVRATAATAGLTLLEPARVKELLAREKGLTTPRPDPLEELRGLNGAEFDRRFAELMTQGHRELITLVEAAQSTVTSNEVKGLLAETLPALRHHEEMAMALGGTIEATAPTDDGQD